jgi:hypothetical protein
MDRTLSPLPRQIPPSTDENMTRALALLLGLVVANGCDCGLEPLQQIPDPPPEPVDPEPETGRGGVQGRVCAADGETWLAGARVFVQPAGTEELIEDFSLDDGRWQLGNIPEGDQVVHIEKGSFSTQKVVTIVANSVVTIPEDACELDRAPRIAVVRGSQYDNVEAVLNELGVEAEAIEAFEDNWAEQLLNNDDGLANYDILFLNCRSEEEPFVSRPDMQQRLRDFVAAGGSLHASDQAYDLIEAAFPDKIDFLGDDSVRGDADLGASVDALPAAVLSSELAAQLSATTVPLKYGLATWSVMTSVDDGVDIYLEADAPLLGDDTFENAPQIVGFNHGLGRVVYSSFHQEPGIGALQEQVLKLIMFEL